MEQNKNSSFIKSLRSNVFETLMKIQNDNLQDLNSPKALDLASLINQKSSPLPVSPRNPKNLERTFGMSDVQQNAKRKNEQKVEEKDLKNARLKHFQTSVNDGRISPMQKFPQVLSPASEMDLEESEQSSGHWTREDVYMQGMRKSPSGNYLNTSRDLFDYKNLYETELKNKQFFQEKYKTATKENESLKSVNNSLKAELELENSANEQKTLRLLNEIKLLKSKTLELEAKLRKASKPKDPVPEIKKWGAEVNEKEIEIMTKQEIYEQLLLMKQNNEKLSQKILDQADELFEKNNEIKQLLAQKSSLFKELNNLHEQNSELTGTREHVSTLINIIRKLKGKIHNIADIYKKFKGHEEESVEEKNTDEVLDSITRLSNIVDKKLQNISQKKRKNQLELVRSFGGSQLVYHLKGKIDSLISNNT